MNDRDKLLMASVLEKYELGKNIQSHEILNIKKFKSDLYALANVWSFDYRNNQYYVSDDYSLDNNPKYAQNIFQEINHLLRGHLIKNAHTKSVELYSVTIGSDEYYLWQANNS